jgi:hypothetical protein
MSPPVRLQSTTTSKPMVTFWDLRIVHTKLYALFLAGTEVGIRFTFDNTLGQKMVITFPIVKLAGESPKINSPMGVNLPMTFQARRSDTDLTDVIVEITNTLSAIEV